MSPGRVSRTSRLEVSRTTVAMRGLLSLSGPCATSRDICAPALLPTAGRATARPPQPAPGESELRCAPARGRDTGPWHGPEPAPRPSPRAPPAALQTSSGRWPVHTWQGTLAHSPGQPPRPQPGRGCWPLTMRSDRGRQLPSSRCPLPTPSMPRAGRQCPLPTPSMPRAGRQCPRPAPSMP